MPVEVWDIFIIISTAKGQKQTIMPQNQRPKKKITLSQLKRYLPLPPPPFPPTLPTPTYRYLTSPTFSNLSLVQQSSIRQKYETVYRNYYALEDIVQYVGQLTGERYSAASVRRMLANCVERYGVVDWYKLVRIVNGTERHRPGLEKVDIVNQVKGIFRRYLKKRVIWKGVQQVAQTKRNIDARVLDQLCKQTLRQVKEFIDRNRHACQQALYTCQQEHPKTINFILLQKLINKDMEMYLDRKKVIYLYLNFDPANRGFVRTHEVLAVLLIVKKAKPVKKESYYLTDLEELMSRIRAEMNLLFYSAHELQNDFHEFYSKKQQQQQLHQPQPQDDNLIDQQLFYQYISQKCERRYSRYMINKLHKKIQFKQNIHFLYNKPNLPDLSKLIESMLAKRKKKRILKKENQVFYSFRSIILYLVSRCKVGKLTKQKLGEFLVQNQQPMLMYKSFYAVWRVYPNIINSDRIKKQSKLSQLACFYKIRKSDEEYDKMYETMLDLMPEDAICTYEKLQEKINMNLEFVLDVTKIKPLPLDRYDEVNYRQAIRDIFQPDFQLDIRSYIHRKVSEKAYALWKGYKAMKAAKARAEMFSKMMVTEMVPHAKASIDSSNTAKKLKPQKSKSSLYSKKQKPIYNPQSLQIVSWNLTKLLNQLPTTTAQTRKQYHTDEHIRSHLCVNPREHYEYRTLTPRFVMHPIPGLVGMGENLMFLSKGKLEVIGVKFFYKPDIEVIDFVAIGNDIAILTSYFTVELYSLAQDSSYSYQTIQLLEKVRNITFSSLDTICQDRLYSRFPIFIRVAEKKLVINTTIANNRVLIVDVETNEIERKIQVGQREHVLGEATRKVLGVLGRSGARKGGLYGELVKELARDEVSLAKIKAILMAELQQQQNQGKPDIPKLSESQLKSFLTNMQQFPPALTNCILKQQLQLLKQHKIADSLNQVLSSLMSYMLTNNISLASVMGQIDKDGEGFIKIKSLKDYLLKITQSIYTANQKQIDLILRNMAVGRNIEYDTFLEITTKSWPYAIWQRPYLILRDYAYIEDCHLMLYTLEGSQCVYAKNVQDGRVVASMGGHTGTPVLYFVQEGYVLVTGDLGTIRVWRLYEDLVKKYDENPPWEIKPYAVIPQAHDSMITSITYLSRAHHFVTTSLDSTTKFWKINPYNSKDQPVKSYLQEVKRFYSNQYIYLNSKSMNILLDGEGCRLELLALSKISKQINENNKYKYEMKVQLFQVENTIVKTGPNNLHLELPPKLKTKLESYVDSLGIKKSILLAKTINQMQHQTMKNNLISDNLQKTLYESVKNFFIFDQIPQLKSICQYLTRKNISGQIVRVLFEKYGIGIPKANPYAIMKLETEQLLRPEEVGMYNADVIEISQDQIEFFTTKIKQTAKNGSLKLEQALSIGSSFLNVINFEKYETILEEYLAKNPNEFKMIEIAYILSAFRPLKLNSQLDRLYAILRSANILMRQKGIKQWNIFTYNKAELEKRKKTTQGQFDNFMKNLGIGEQKRKLMVSYLSKNKSISLDDYVYYTKLAWQSVGFDMNQSNFSKIFMKNSRFLQTNLEMFKLDSGIEIERPEFEDKVKNLQDSVAISNSNLRESISRRSSKKVLREQQAISQSHSAQKDSQSKQRQKKRSLDKSQSQRREQGGISIPISSSNSRVSLSHESQAKDEYTREILSIVKRINQKMKNEGKTIWEITSLSVPQFMENHLITEPEYFNILSGIKSPIYLNDKLKLMGYIMRESDQYSAVDLNILFQLFSSQPNQRWGSKLLQNYTLPGEKHIVTHIISKVNETNSILQHCLSQYLFNDKQELSIDQILNRFSERPFSMLNFCIRQLESLLTLQNKSAFNLDQIKLLLEERIKKFNIKVESKEITFIEQIIHQTDNRGLKLQQLLLKSATNNGIVNYPIFSTMVGSFFHEKQVILQNEFIKILLHIQEEKKAADQSKDKAYESPSRFNKMKGSPKKLGKSAKPLTHEEMLKKSQFKYKQLISYVNKMIEAVKKSSNSQKDGVKKFLKALENKKLSLLMFFVSLDRTRNYFINEVQFVAGLSQLKVSQNFWSSIKKKNSKKLFYFQMINYLVQNQFVNYKCVDSELEAAMTKFVKRFVRNDDIQAVYDRIRAKESDEPFNTTYITFQKALKMGNLFKEQEISLIFGAFVNANSLKSSNFSNDTLIKDPTNVHKTFNFKMFTDVINNYRNQNTTKTPHYKLCHFFKKRGISLMNQFIKWMERNKKIKQIAEAIKLKQYTLPRELYVNFIKQLGTELQQKQIKQMLGTFSNPLQFSNLNQKLQQIYKKGNANIETEQITAYLQQIYKKIKKFNVTTVRLFQDFSKDKFKMNINQFSDMVMFLEIGLTKIQNKMIFGFVDLEKKGFITVNQLENALQDAGESLEKQEDQYELDYIIEKLVANRDKYVLKPSRITYNLDRAMLIFTPILTSEQIILLYKNAQEHFKSSDITEKNMEQFILDKEKESKAKKDKKYKELIINFLKFLKKANLDVKEAYFYFSKDTGTLTKNKFLLSYQSLGLKSTILEINALYSYLDEGKTGSITLQKWQEKLNIVEYEKQNMEGVSGEELQVFYKVKLILADIYLIFVRKLFRSKQIAAYFDVNGTSEITYQQFLQSLDKLGMHLQEAIEGKLTNYLDKNRLGEISVHNLVYELENCLTSKAKLILETKTSCIFKEKVHLVQQKQAYFIEKLVKAEHFLDSNEKLQSCILVTDFIDVIKDFGIVLGQDEFSDVQRNFKFNKENLLLYPLYFMFINIFKSYENSLSSDEMQRIRYQKLFHTIIKNGLSMKIFDKMKTIKEASVFLSQLKIFTPIQIKLLIESVCIQGSNLVDVDLLIQKTRDSFLQSGELMKNTGMISEFRMDRKEMMKQWLKEQLDGKKVTDILKANTGKINKDIFESLLLKLGLILKKSDISDLFIIFGKGQDFILIQNLISSGPKPKPIDDAAKEEQSKYETHLNILLDHICKSLDFKGVSLQEAWQKYFTNYGFISEQSFYSFLDEIGFSYKEKEYEKFIPKVMTNYRNQTKLNELKVSEFEALMKANFHVPQKQSKTQKYFVESRGAQRISQILRESPEFIENFDAFIQSQGLNQNRLALNSVYSYIKAFFKKHLHGHKKSIAERDLQFYANLVFKKSELTASQFVSFINGFLKGFMTQKYRRNAIKTEPQDASVMLHDPSSASFQKSLTAKLNDILPSHEEIMKKICQQNFIMSYNYIVANFQEYVSSLHVPIQNIYRLCLNLVVEKLLQNDYLLFIKPKLTINPTISTQEKIKKLHFTEHNLKFNMKIVPNLIIDKEELLADKAVYLVNEKYYAMNVSDKKDFEALAIVSNLLDPNLVFLRAKNYYLWQPNDNPLPKQSINFRWKFIPMCLLTLCKQLNSLQEYGYALPHLRWDNLHSQLGITRVLFPAHADTLGKLHHILHENLLKLDDPYCAPELFRKKSGLTLKINTWIFGCIIYEFVWGHQPNSFILLLLQYIQSRHSSYDLTDVLKMEQLPSDFKYTPFKFGKIKQVISFQHGLKAEGIPDDFENNIIYFGLRGLVKNLQTIYGNEYMYYRKEFELFEKIHELILECLDPNPDTRPTMKYVLEMLSGLMENQDYKDFNFNEYVNVLQLHQSTQVLNKDLIDPLKIDLKHNSTTQLEALCQKFYERLVKIKSALPVKQIYLIPKKYPWPEQQSQDIYDRQILANKMTIRSHGAYSEICLVENENCLQMLINLYVIGLKKDTLQPKKAKTLFTSLSKSLFLILQMLRSYSTPFSGYIPNILQSFIQLYYRQPFSFTSDPTSLIPSSSSSKQGLMIMSNNGPQQLYALAQIKNIVYLNGSASVEYLPVKHFLADRKQYQMLFSYFYASIDLNCQPNRGDEGPDRRVLAINFFRDKIYDDFFWDIIKYLKVDILMLKLIDQEDLLTHLFSFYKDFTSSPNCQQFPLTFSNIFYLKLGTILQKQLSPLLHKQLVIEIATNILRLQNPKLIKKMNEPAFGMLRQIFKLMIEPSRDTPAHQEYQQLTTVLTQFVYVFKAISWHQRLLSQIQGSETILNALETLIARDHIQQQVVQ